MLAEVLSAALYGVEALLVRVQVDVFDGLPAFTTVGLPDSAVRESRERVRTAIRNAGFPFPNDRITVNLAPADLRKEGAAFDLPIALGILTATGHIKAAGPSVAVVGELALDGQIQPVRGVLAVALACRRAGVPTLLVPAANRAEAAAVTGLRAVTAATLRDAVSVLNGEGDSPEAEPYAPRPVAAAPEEDLADIRGQPFAKRALEVAAAVPTTSSSSAHPALARRCSRGGCPVSCRRSRLTRPWKSRSSGASPVCLVRRTAWSTGGRSEHRTTPSRSRASSAVAVRPIREKSPSPTGASSFSTSYRNSSSTSWSHYASRWRTAG